MRSPGLIYLIFAALLLLSGYNRALAGAQPHKVLSSSVHLQQNGISGCNNDEENLAFLPDTDWDDDDENYLPVRKKASFQDYFSILASVFLFDRAAPTVKNSSQFSEDYFQTFPARYILQRVLRI